MSKNSITAPLHTTMQVQSSVCSMIPFCIICGSHSSVDEDSSLLVFYRELIGKMLLTCKRSMLSTSKGKSVSEHVIKVYGLFEVHFHPSRISVLVTVGWSALCTVIFNTGENPQHQLKMRLGASQNQSRFLRRESLLWIACDCSIIQSMSSSQKTMPTSSMTSVYQLVPLKIWFFFILSFIPDKIIQLLTIQVKPLPGSFDTVNTSGCGYFECL